MPFSTFSYSGSDIAEINQTSCQSYRASLLHHAAPDTCSKRWTFGSVMYHTDRQRFGSWSWIINVHRWGIKEAGEIMVGVCGIPWHLSGVSPHSCVQGRTRTLHLPPHIMLLDQSKVFLDNGINSFSNLFYQLTIDNCNAIWNIMTYIHGSIKYQLYIYRLLPH